MNKIGFQNFRKFHNFPELEYGPITFLVGANNSGKSTMVKALLLIYNYLKSNNYSRFYFGSNVIQDANIFTFGRAKNKSSREKSIIFSFSFNRYRLEIQIGGEEDMTFARVYSFKMIDDDTNITFELKPIEETAYISRTHKASEYINKEDNIKNDGNELESKLIIQRSELQNQLKEGNLKKGSKQYLLYIDQINKLNDKIGGLVNNYYVATKDQMYKISYDYINSDSIKNIFSLIIAFSLHDHEVQYNLIQKGNTASANFNNLRGIKEDEKIIESSLQNFSSIFEALKIDYIAANPAKQTTLFLVRDTYNILAQALHEFNQRRILKGQPAYLFIEKWMRLFGIGDSFEITMHGGEAYELNIIEGRSKIPMADKGMGSLQIMMILFKIAVSINNKLSNNGRHFIEIFIPEIFKTIIIEEPELNLHPAYQSLLADLFFEVHSEYKINFIIETHSEYLIRKTQLIVKDKELEASSNENPFCVLYFGSDLKQWKMSYREDGKFIEEFGTGFFDETRKIVKKMME